MACTKCGYRKDGPGLGRCFCAPVPTIEQEAAWREQMTKQVAETAALLRKQIVSTRMPTAASKPPTDCLTGGPVDAKAIYRCPLYKSKVCECYNRPTNCMRDLVSKMELMQQLSRTVKASAPPTSAVLPLPLP